MSMPPPGVPERRMPPRPPERVLPDRSVDRGVRIGGWVSAVLMLFASLLHIFLILVTIDNKRHWDRIDPGRFPTTGVDIAGWVIAGLSILGYLAGVVLWRVGLARGARTGTPSPLAVAGVVTMFAPVVGWFALLAFG